MVFVFVLFLLPFCLDLNIFILFSFILLLLLFFVAIIAVFKFIHVTKIQTENYRKTIILALFTPKINANFSRCMFLL